LYAESASYENQIDGGTTTNNIDVTANGFKLRSSNDNNISTATYIYAAFAEFPQGGSNVAPAPAR
jgi:hypothetical protein